MGPSTNLPVMPYPAFQIGRFEAVASEIIAEAKPVEPVEPQRSVSSEDLNARSEPTRQAVMDNIQDAPPVETTQKPSAASIAVTQSLDSSRSVETGPSISLKA